MNGIILAFNLIGGLGLFLFGIKIMSEGLQKVAGERLRSILNKATTNRFYATLSGFLVTCAVQSSSATTVMIVSFCSAGLLTLSQSLGIIFGANIGTTTTAWIISILGFKIKIANFALPLIGIGFFSQFIRRWRMPHRIGEILVGFGILFLGFAVMKDTVPNIADSPVVMHWITAFSPEHLGPRVMLVLLGAILTSIFQSSSAMSAIILTTAASGLISFQAAVALMLGGNIGTTITAILASIGAPLSARRSALGHFLFNILGSIWVILLFHPFLSLVDAIIPGNPYGVSETTLLVVIPIHIAAFHTTFNIINTIIALPLINQLEKLILFFLPEKESKEEPILRYISTPLSATPELALNAAQQEVDLMANVVSQMLKEILDILKGNRNRLDDKIDDILKGERKTDVLEHKINEFISALTHASLSTASNKKVLSLMSMINDLERMGDHCEKLAKLIKRAHDNNENFSKAGTQDLARMAEKTIEVVEAMNQTILNTDGDPLPTATEREKQLNQLRNEIREAHIGRLSKGVCNPYAGNTFSDMLTSFEKMGDHAYNVVEAAVGIK